MKLFLDCLPCMLRQALEAGRMATEDEKVQEKIMMETLAILEDYSSYKNAPQMAGEIHKVIKSVASVNDPYLQRKNQDLGAAKMIYPYLKEFLQGKEDVLYWALKVAATGNNMDAAIYNMVNVKDCVEAELQKKFIRCDADILKEKLTSAKKILILGDNVGETVFDLVLLEQLAGYDIIYGVREVPIINDVTMDTAISSGLDQIAKVVSTGSIIPGTILEDCSKEFKEIYNKADIIISKGQGNYESLSEKKGIFYLLKAKCPMIANRLQVDLNSYVFVYSGD